MNSQINSVLEQIRTKLSESAWGPEIPSAEKGEGGFADSKPGDGGATNNNNIEDSFDQYIDGMVANLLAQYESTPEIAAGVVFDCIEQLVDDDQLPPLPEEGKDEDAVAIWIGKATTMGLQRLVDEYARENAE
jgi:hypothetical protein